MSKKFFRKFPIISKLAPSPANDYEAKIGRFRYKRTRIIMKFRLETVYLGAKRFLYQEKKSEITVENKTIKIPIPVKNDELTELKIPLNLGTDYYIRRFL